MGAVNYYTNFYLELGYNYCEKDRFYQELTDELSEDGIRYVYLYDWDNIYPIYCYSDNRIKIGTYILKQHGLATPLPYLNCDDIFNKENISTSYFIFSKSTFTWLEENNKQCFEQFLSRLRFVGEKKYEGNRFNELVRVYEATEDVFYGENVKQKIKDGERYVTE